MKQSFITILLTVLMSMTGAKSFANDIAVANDDGVTIYYNYINDGKYLEVAYGGGYSGSIVIPAEVTYMNRTRKVTRIAGWAFYGCSHLTSITIPNSVTSIGDYAFSRCEGLTSVTIPNFVTNIGESAFAFCGALSSVTIGNSVTNIEKEAFAYCTSLSSVTIPNTVTSIGDHAFCDCSSLSSVNIPNSVTNIGAGSFAGCSSLSSVSIPSSATSIGRFAFSNCSGLTSVTIPNSVMTIGDWSFNGCSGLTSVTIPNSVTTIGDKAFADCSGLTSIVSLIEEPFVIAGKLSDNKTFDLDVFNNVTLYIPVGMIDKYKSTEGWKDFLFIEEGTGPSDGGDTPTVQKCANPTIGFQNGKLSFTCATPDVEFHWSIKSINGENGSGSGISSDVPLSFSVSVYATKTGCLNSDTETRQFDCNTGGLKGDVDGDGVVNVADHVKLSDIILNQNK